MKLISSAACCRTRRPVVCPSWRQFSSSRPRQAQKPATATAHGNPLRAPAEIDVTTKTVTTAVGPLPLSPFMDPTYHQAKLKFFKTKNPPPTVYKKTKFQRHLARNPYALALATPLRRCPVTHYLIPRFFLQGFRLVAHPETGQPWWVPIGLEKKQPVLASTDTDPSTAAEDDDATVAPDPEQEQEPEQDEQEPEQGEHEPDTESAPTNSSQPTKHGLSQGPTAWPLSRQDLLQGMVSTKSRHYNAYRKFLRQNNATRYSPTLNCAVWREDMDTLVLDTMRQRIVEGLLQLAEMVEKEDRKYLIRCETWDEVKNYKHRGCLLFLGQDVASVDDAASGAAPNDVSSPLPARLSSMDIEGVKFGRKLAVHDLRALLGDENIALLRQESPVLRPGSLFLLGRQRSLDLQLQLWRLQGYILTALP
ncbi:hypothetical protein B0T22DRAFT_482371 [Podospora appendiculata]|uniref:Esterase-like protein n=1 Tax=Podospora appendiculata TaxID=314037 RepID=A0AAE0X4Z5_9PEZI|nr:hypothetical protein B0T22DRAFT_482371 [Podospora appendiculata]